MCKPTVGDLFDSNDRYFSKFIALKNHDCITFKMVAIKLQLYFLQCENFLKITSASTSTSNYYYYYYHYHHYYLKRPASHYPGWYTKFPGINNLGGQYKMKYDFSFY